MSVTPWENETTMTAKISPQAAELLIIIDEHSVLGDDGRFWIPPSGYNKSYSDTLGRAVFIYGAGIARSLKALERRGLIVFNPIVAYASQVTEQGRMLVESWRENNTWPVKVAV